MAASSKSLKFTRSIKDLPAEKPKRKIKLWNMADVPEKTLRWLWYPYMPVGNSTMLFGMGGKGKSFITAKLAADISAGRPLPGQEGHSPVPQKVLMMSAEDDMSYVLRPRLMAMGANMSNIFVPEEPFTLDQTGIRLMEDMMTEAAATIVFLDPIVQYMGGAVDMFKMNEVRSIMGPLQQMAMKTQTTMLIVHHARKMRDGDPQDWAAGSGDFTNAVRSSLLATNTNDGGYMLMHVKSNYGPKGDSLIYEFGDNNLQWGDFIDREDAERLLPSNREKNAEAEELATTKRKHNRVHAVIWLKEFLSRGPQRATDVQIEAAKHGFNARTLERAKLGVVESVMVMNDGKPVWFWRLHNDKTEVSSLVRGPSVKGKTVRERDHDGKVDEASEGTGRPVSQMGLRGHDEGGETSGERKRAGRKASAHDWLKERGLL